MSVQARRWYLLLFISVGSALLLVAAFERWRTGWVAVRDSRPSSENDLPATPAQIDQRLQERLDAVALRFEGTFSAAVRNLRTGAAASINAEQRVRAASLYKLFVLYATQADLQAGRLTEEETLTLSERAADAEPYIESGPGTRTSVACAQEAMITVSNNAAAAMLVERLGGEARVTAEMRALGLLQSELTPERAFTSASDIARLLELIALKQAINRQASETMLALLAQQRKNDRLPLPLPLSVRVAHKTGELAKLRNDAGVVYAPSGPYVFVALAGDASSERAARQAIVDLSAAVYSYFEPQGLPQYLGLPPRLAKAIFRLPDSQGRLPLLDDEIAETAPLRANGVLLADGADEMRLRDIVVPDLLALQQAADEAGSPFWVTAGYRGPTGVDWAMALPNATTVRCPMELPPAPTAAVQTPPKPTPATRQPTSSQQWLGTVVGLADAANGKPSATSYAASEAGRWLLANAWQYGFILAPAESDEGRALGYEPWKLRWVGRAMAMRLHGMGYEANPTVVAIAELQRVARDLESQQ